jgi:hypothetical protein
MATQKTSNTSNAKPGVQYHTSGGHGNLLTVDTAPPGTSPTGVPMLKIGSPANFIMLTQLNAADLAPILSSFGSTGVLT